jgi:hypothetical protein
MNSRLLIHRVTVQRATIVRDDSMAGVETWSNVPKLVNVLARFSDEVTTAESDPRLRKEVWWNAVCMFDGTPDIRQGDAILWQSDRYLVVGKPDRNHNTGQYTTVYLQSLKTPNREIAP